VGPDREVLGHQARTHLLKTIRRGPSFNSSRHRRRPPPGNPRSYA
jgi:hypothetical protein